MEFCKEYDIKIVADEIQTGLGRTGKMWACEHYGVIPDILVTSKALGGGLPIAAFVVDARMINENLHSGWDSETFYASPLACVAALATIKVIEKEKLVANVRWVGEILGQRLRVFEKRFPQYFKVRGLGLMWGLEFMLNGKPDQASRDKFLKEAVEEGLLVMGAGRGKPAKNPVVRFLFPLCITKEEIDMVMDKVEKILLYSHP
jgi:4-aminobutyrate aminotransferase-like enzyme